MNTSNRKILILDDQEEILNMVYNYLSKQGFTNLKKARTKNEAIELLESEDFEFAILDILLPDGSGFDVLSYIKKTSNIPTLFLSAISDIENQYKGFELGADDYIVKPFKLRDLELRINSILNRAYPENNFLVKLSNCEIDFERAIIRSKDSEIPMTAKEYNILKSLYENKNRIVTFDSLLSNVWGPSYLGYENSLMVHIRNIRQKIEKNPSQPDHLITIKGLGYKLKV